MAVSANYLAYVIDQLNGLGAIRSRRMFGGIGLYCDELFFALIDDDVLYFKVDDSNRDDYTKRGCKAFRPLADDPSAVSLNYFQVPEEVLEDRDDARAWARKSVLVAAASSVKKATRSVTQKASKRHKAAATRRTKR